MKKSHASQGRRRQNTKMSRKVKRFFKKVSTITLMVIFTAIVIQAGVKASNSSGFDTTGVDQIQAEYESKKSSRREETANNAMKFASIKTGREVVEQTTTITTIVVPEEIMSGPSEEQLETTMIKQTEVVEETPKAMLSAYKASETYYYFITDAEKMQMAKVVWKESRGESLEGQVAVAATIFNRLMCDDPAIHNDSINSVITQRGAYASIADVSPDEARTCMEAVELACKGWDPTRAMFENGARFFYAQSWISAEELAKREGVTKQVIGNHTFHDDFA